MKNEFSEFIKEESRIWTGTLLYLALPCLVIVGIVHFFPDPWGWVAIGSLAGAGAHWVLQHIV